MYQHQPSRVLVSTESFGIGIDGIEEVYCHDLDFAWISQDSSDGSCNYSNK